MKKINFISKAKKVIVIVLIFLISSFFLSFYPPFTKLNRVKTTHFIIYYQDNVKHLVNEEFFQDMENMYNYLSALVNYNFKNKIYVYFSNTEKIANGFANPMGSPTIYVITTPPSLESSVGNYGSWLHYVFFHELTHIFSLDLKNNFVEFISGVFGNVFIFNMFNNPNYMIEGITVSLEGNALKAAKASEYGDLKKIKAGRVFSPVIKEYIMQTIVDGKFKKPDELDNYKLWPGHGMFYWYGGNFSYFLQKKYGMEKYIALWHATLKVSFKKAIKVVYDKNLSDLWDEFYNFMKPDFDIYTSFEDVLKYSKNQFLFNGKFIVDKDNYYYYYYNYSNKSIYRYNFKYKRNEILLKNVSTFKSFDVSKDNSSFILTYIDIKGSNYILKHNVYKIEKLLIKNSLNEIKDEDFKIKKAFYLKNSNSVRELSFFFDGIFNNTLFLGIDVSRSLTDLILIDKKGNKKVLLKGSKDFYISNPFQLNLDTIVFLGSLKGEKSIYLLKTGKSIAPDKKYDKDIKVYKIKTYGQNIGFLNVIDGKIVYSYNNDMTFYKFGMIDGNKEYSLEKNYSGGIFNPFYYKGYIFYIGRFTDNFRLLKLKFSLNELNKKQKNDKNVKANKNNKPVNNAVDYIKISKIKYIRINPEKEIYKNDIIKSKNNDKDNSKDNENNINNNDKNYANNVNKNDNKDFNYYEYSTRIFPFNENLLPDFWIPVPSILFNSDFSKIYYGGTGINFVFLNNITGGYTDIGLYYNDYDPFSFSAEYITSINLFNPLKIVLYTGYYNLYDILSQDKIMKKMIKVQSDFIFSKVFFPSYNNLYFDFSIDYSYDNLEIEKSFFSINFYLERNLIGASPFKYNINSAKLFYYSNVNGYDNFKFELSHKFKFKDFSLLIENNFAFSFNRTLSFYGINDYYEDSLYEPLFELQQINPDNNFNFLEMFKVNLILFEVENMDSFLNMFSQAGFYTGAKYIIYGNTNTDVYNILNINFKNLNISYKDYIFYYLRLKLSVINNLFNINIYASTDENFSNTYFGLITDFEL